MTAETNNQPKPKVKEPQKPPPTAETVTSEHGSYAVGRATAGAGASPRPPNQTHLNPATSVFTSIVMRQMASGTPLEMPGHKTARGLRETTVLQMQHTIGNTQVQRKLATSMCQRCGATPCNCPDKEKAIQRQTASIPPTTTDVTATPAEGLIVDDSVEELQPGQMHKSEFLNTLKTAVCTTADDALSGTIYSAVGCPYIARIFSQLPGRSPQYIERGIHLFVPETTEATTATAYINPIAIRVRAGIANWLESGEVTGVPPELADLGGIATSEETEATVEQEGAESVQRMPELEQVQRELGEGRPLDSSIRSRMEAGFGQSMGNVVIHTDTTAARLAHRQEARAFTIGKHIVFDSGEYQPGTPTGDAVLAHELAHVAQQSSATSFSPLIQQSAMEDNLLEAEANSSATGVVASLWGRTRGAMTTFSQNAVPRLKSGLRLQRCSRTSSGPIGPARLATARSNFRSHNSDLTDPEKDKINEAIRVVAGDNINLQISFYDYYSSHGIKKASSRELARWPAGQYASTSPSSDTIVRPSVLAPNFASNTLGGLLIHEFTHTRHETNFMGMRDYQEGDSYGIEYFFAKRTGDTTREREIGNLMRHPTSLALPTLVPALLDSFRTSYATMVGLYEVIDTGHSSRTGTPFTHPPPLTADQARMLATEVVSLRPDSHSSKLQAITTWIRAHLSSFTIPI